MQDETVDKDKKTSPTRRSYMWSLATVTVCTIVGGYLQWSANPYCGYFYAGALIGLVVLALMASRDPAIRLLKKDGTVDGTAVSQKVDSVKEIVSAWFEAYDSRAPATLTQRVRALLGVYIGAAIITVPIMMLVVPGDWLARLGLGLGAALGVVIIDFVFAGNTSDEKKWRWPSVTRRARTFLRGLIGGFGISWMYLLAIAFAVAMGHAINERNSGSRPNYPPRYPPVGQTPLVPRSDGRETERFWASTIRQLYPMLSPHVADPEATALLHPADTVRATSGTAKDQSERETRLQGPLRFPPASSMSPDRAIELIRKADENQTSKTANEGNPDNWLSEALKERIEEDLRDGDDDPGTSLYDRAGEAAQSCDSSATVDPNTSTTPPSPGTESPIPLAKPEPDAGESEMSSDTQSGKTAGQTDPDAVPWLGRYYRGIELSRLGANTKSASDAKNVDNDAIELARKCLLVLNDTDTSEQKLIELRNECQVLRGRLGERYPNRDFSLPD